MRAHRQHEKREAAPALADDLSAINLKDEVPFGLLQYSLTPGLVRSLAFAHRTAGAISSVRFGYYDQKRLQGEADRVRIAELVGSADQRLTLDEVAHVLAGDVLPPRRAQVQELIRRAAILVDAVGIFSQRDAVSTAEAFAVYHAISGRDGDRGATSWARFSGRERTLLLDQYRVGTKVDPKVAKLYEWLAADESLAREGLLRAAVLHWGLNELCRAPVSVRMAVGAAVAHELRAGGFDHGGLFVLSDFERGREALSLSGALSLAAKARVTGDVTPLLEHFAHYVGLALHDHSRRIEKHQEAHARLPWLVVRPPDEMDRQIFDAVEKRGSATSPVILEALPHPRPPLRTLQRRLQKLVHDGLLVKHGTRKDAFYRVAERT